MHVLWLHMYVCIFYWYFGLCLTKYGYIQLYTPAAWPLVAMRMREGPKPCLWPAVGLEELLDQVALPLHLSHCFLSAPVYVVTYLDYFVFHSPDLAPGHFLSCCLSTSILTFSIHASMTSTAGPFYVLAPVGLDFAKTFDD